MIVIAITIATAIKVTGPRHLRSLSTRYLSCFSRGPLAMSAIVGAAIARPKQSMSASLQPHHLGSLLRSDWKERWLQAFVTLHLHQLRPLRHPAVNRHCY